MRNWPLKKKNCSPANQADRLISHTTSCCVPVHTYNRSPKTDKITEPAMRQGQLTYNQHGARFKQASFCEKEWPWLTACTFVMLSALCEKQLMLQLVKACSLHMGSFIIFVVPSLHSQLHSHSLYSSLTFHYLSLFPFPSSLPFLFPLPPSLASLLYALSRSLHSTLAPFYFSSLSSFLCLMVLLGEISQCQHSYHPSWTKAVVIIK